MAASSLAALIAALERAWDDIRHQHPDLPPVVLVTARGSNPSNPCVLVGRTAARRWRSGCDERELDEVFLAGEGLERSAHEVLATLLHEGAHSLARVREIKDTSRQHRYHNDRFKALADELGLVSERHHLAGWATTSLPTTTAGRYAGTITALERELQLYRCHERVAPRPPPSTHRSRAYVCACGRRVRVAYSVYAQGAILCANCVRSFDPVE